MSKIFAEFLTKSLQFLKETAKEYLITTHQTLINKKLRQIVNNVCFPDK